jgi:hypothetical protein
MAGTADVKPQATVFYSWQSDLPNATNRGLILDALERAARTIRADGSVAVEPVVDRDTQNVPGAPNIADTIMQKIERATAFVADVSVINPGLGRPTPNPNVLVELGYALKALGSSRAVLVANTANGPVESLPFDLRTKRVLTYHLRPGEGDKPEQRRKLQEAFTVALRAILADASSSPSSVAPSVLDQAVNSIEAAAPSQASLCARVVQGIAQCVRERTPQLVREKSDGWDEELVEAIQQTLPLVTDFAKVADAAAVHDSRDAALGLLRGFAPLFAQYSLEPGFGGSFYTVQFDLPKFIGHELMVVLFAALIGERRWTAVAELCRETVMIPTSANRFSTETPVTFLYASENVELLEYRNKRLKLNRASLHADILKERHEAGQLGEVSPWRRFQDADVFLYLRSAVAPDKLNPYGVWGPWSAALLAGTPGYLLEATRRDKAEQLLGPLGATSVAELRTRLKEAIAGLRRLFGQRNPFYRTFHQLDPDLIGTE